MSELRELVNAHRHKLNLWNFEYRIGNPSVSDLQYDTLLKELAEIERQHPELDDLNSPTHRIGCEPFTGDFRTVDHLHPMLSIENVYNEDDLKIFLEKAASKVKNPSWIVEPKIDGVAISLLYKNGILIQALTRGTGKAGEDILENIKTIPDIPIKIKHEENGEIEIRGEIYMTRKALSEYNKANSKALANPRNATAGAVKLKDPRECAKRPLRFFSHTFVSSSSNLIKSQWDFLTWCKHVNIPVTQYWLCDSIDCVLKSCNQLVGNNHTSEDDKPYETDGIVIKLNDFIQREELGTGSIGPRWVVALKQERWETETTINSISWDGPSPNGSFTPVAELEPVELAGSVIRRATLHNIDNIKNKDIRIGDRIVLSKAGKVIPHVVQSLTPHEGKNDIRPPETCPCCGEKLLLIDE